MAYSTGIAATPSTTLSSPSLEDERRELPFRFTGTAGEYFRIWVVNTFLVIMTLGLWSPWAKIRKRRFFLRNTWVAAANFEYHARPWPILWGRLIAGIAFIIYWFTGEINPRYAPWVAMLVSALAPWLVVSSLRFNLTNTSYRNIRFQFDGTLRDGIKAMWPVPFIALLTVMHLPATLRSEEGFRAWSWTTLVPTLAFVVLYPYLAGASRRLQLNYARYGLSPCSCEVPIKTYYSIYLKGVMIVISIVLVGGFVMSFVTSFIFLSGGKTLSNSTAMMVLSSLVAGLPTLLALALGYCYTQSQLVNAVFNQTMLSNNVYVQSRLTLGALFRVYSLNLLAILLTLGLAIPWAAIRMAKLRVESTALLMDGEFEDIIADAVPGTSATADAGADFFSFDVSL